MAALNETRNCADIQETFDGQGYLVKYHANGILKTAAVDDNPMGVTAAESSRDASGSLEAAGTGTVAVYPLSGIVYVKCMGIASNVTKFGLPLYCGTTDGYADDDSSNSATLIGYYAGEDGLTITAGDLVPVFVVGHN
tara:strand:+ start:21 stop:434 length:414 start_codon:yes stop_codon:yes gene_type:complete